MVAGVNAASAPSMRALGARLAGSVAVVAMALLGPSDAARAQDPASDEPARLMNDLMTGKTPVGGPFTLRDTAGRQRSLAEFRGKVVLLVFGYTGCPDVCPAELAEVARLLDTQDADGTRLQAIFITLDPERDTAAILRDYVAAFHPRLLALRGSAEETRALARAYKVAYRRVAQPGSAVALVDHSAFIYVLDRAGKFVAFFPPGTEAGRMAVMLRELGVDAAQR
jgi:protein SCO1/2